MGNLRPLERLEFDPPPSQRADPGARGELKWLRLDQLYIDDEYQRPILAAGKKNIKRVIEEMSWSLFAPVVVAPRGDGKYAVIDGQHRSVAALLNGHTKEVPCYVIKGGPEAEALAFAVINGNVTKVSPLMIHAALVASGQRDACRLSAVCARAGVSIAPYPKQDCKKGETLAIGTVKEALARFGESVLVLAMRSITETGDGNAGLVREGIITGTCDVLEYLPGWQKDPAGFIREVAKLGVPRLWKDALRNKGKAGSGSGSARAHYFAVLRDRLPKASVAPKPAAQDKPHAPPAARRQMLAEPTVPARLAPLAHEVAKYLRTGHHDVEFLPGAMFRLGPDRGDLAWLIERANRQRLIDGMSKFPVPVQ